MNYELDSSVLGNPLGVNNIRLAYPHIHLVEDRSPVDVRSPEHEELHA